jgi:hypothetical protein
LNLFFGWTTLINALWGQTDNTTAQTNALNVAAGFISTFAQNNNFN